MPAGAQADSHVAAGAGGARSGARAADDGRADRGGPGPGHAAAQVQVRQPQLLRHQAGPGPHRPAALASLAQGLTA